MRTSLVFRSLLLAGCAGLGASSADAQVLVDQTFDAPGQNSNFLVNGQPMHFFDELADGYIGVPFQDFQGITIGTGFEQEDGSVVINPDVTGDLSRYPAGLTIEVDIRVFRLVNFFGEDMDPTNFPLTLQFWDIPADGGIPVSVYRTGDSMPLVSDGWTRFTFVLPDTTQTALPAGWGGTGDEDPNTFEPILPPGRTFADVLASVDRLTISTFRPGFFYVSSFWEVGFDDLRISVNQPPFACNDFNRDGEVNADDLGDYINCYFSLPPCEGADFNQDGDVNPDDLGDFINAYFGGC
ncbi:MAG: hypothetical protein AB7K52_01460 [Phycisphaerales bacterium]